MPSLIKCASVLILLVGTSFAWASESLWTHQFAAESGFPISLSQQAPVAGGKTLVMFWASWCLPCKGELSELAKRKGELPANLRIIAVNVDDPSGLPQAQSFLASVRWPFQVLRDTSGQFFYEYNHSGQLPYSVLLSSGGQELKSFQLLTELDIQELIKMPAVGVAVEEAPSVQSGTNAHFGFRTEAVDFTGSNGINNRLSTFSGYGRVDLENWSAQLQYDYLYEETGSPRRYIHGDELGYSYLEYHRTIGPGRAQVRLGDSRLSILSGELLSLQNIPNLTDPSSLRGGSAQWAQGDWSFLAYGGEIHPALFASPINPAIDLALPVPGEKVEGASAFWHQDNADTKTQVNLNYVNYHRSVNLGLGLASPVNDQRVGAEVYHSIGHSGVQVRGAQFSTNTGLAGVDAEKPYIIDPYFWWNFPGLEHQIYSLHFIEYQSLPVRTLTPVLVENPALPLQAAKIRSFRFSPKFFNEDETIWFEPIWIFEEAIALLPYERQNSFGFNLSFPKSDRKVIGFFQDAILSPTSTYQESSVLATSPIYGALTGQLLLRHHNASPVGGDSDGLNLGLDLSQLWALPFVGKLILSSQYTKQSGYYFGFSGIARADLLSGHLEWSEGVSTVRVGVGSEPGGIVCTNGVCVQKPPLDGANLEVAFSF